MNLRKALRACLILASAFLFVAGIHDSLGARLTMSAAGAVAWVERDPYSEFNTHNFVVHYTFRTAQQSIVEGQYLFENALTIGDVPRHGSAMHIAYSAYNPAINHPQDGEAFVYEQVFQALFLFSTGSILLLAGFNLR